MRYYMPCLRERNSGSAGIIHLSIDTHSKLLNIIASLNGDVHKSTNLVIEESSMCFLNFSRSSLISGITMKVIFSNDISTGKGEC